MTSAAAAFDSRREISAISLIGLGHFVSHFYQLVLPPLFPFIRPDLDVSYTALGFVMTVYFVATAVVQLPVGVLVDRVGARPVLAAGLLLHGAAVAAAGLLPGYWALLVCFALGGLANSVFHPADYAILSASVREERHGRAFGLHSFGGSIGFVAAPVFMLALNAQWGWRTAFVAAGALGIVVGLIVLAATETLRDHAPGSAPRKGKGKSEAAADWRFMLSRPMVAFFLFYAFASGSGTGMTNFSVVAMIEVYGVSDAFASAMLSAFLTAALAGTLPGGWFAERTRRQDVAVAAMFLVAALAIAAVGTGWLAVWAVAAAILIAGFMRGLYNASRDILVRQAAPAGRVGSAFGFVTVGYTVGQGGTPVVYGWFMDIGSGQAVFYVAAAFALLAMATVFLPQSAGKR